MGAAWRTQLADKVEIVSKEYLVQQGFTEKELRTMFDLGYTATEIKGNCDVCKTKAEKQFFRNLMEGTEEYDIEAFETDPYVLSEHLTFIMSEYGYRLLEHNQLDKLTDLNNAVLRSE